jgi:hypothetical protein
VGRTVIASLPFLGAIDVSQTTGSLSLYIFVIWQRLVILAVKTFGKDYLRYILETNKLLS